MHLDPRLLVNIALAATLFSATMTAPGADPRTPLPEHVGGWQRALFPLRIPVTRLTEGRTRHFTEHCTAVAITPGPNSLFVSAWHCFDDYRSTITPIQLIDPRSAKQVQIQMKLLDTGGSMQEDWALLTPDSPFTIDTWIPISTTPHHIGQPLIAAGFAPQPNQSGDEAAERYLLADAACSVIDGSAHPPASDCVAKKGASGGAMIALTDSGSARLQGIISAGDGKSVSYFYPAPSLIRRLSRLR